MIRWNLSRLIWVITMSDYNDEAVIRLGMRCIEDLTEEYLARHGELDLQSYRLYLKRHLNTECWLRSVIDPDEIIECMERVRQEKLRTDAEYRAICLKADKEIKKHGE